MNILKGITYTAEQMQAIRARLTYAQDEARDACATARALRVELNAAETRWSTACRERNDAVAHLRVICTLNDPPPVELALAREFLYKFDRQHIRTVWSSNAALNPPNTRDRQ